MVQVKLMLKEQSDCPKQEEVRAMPGRRKTGKCLTLGGCYLKLVLNCKGSAADSVVSRCVQTFSSDIVVNTKMFTGKKCKSSKTCSSFQKVTSQILASLNWYNLFFLI